MGEIIKIIIMELLMLCSKAATNSYFYYLLICLLFSLSTIWSMKCYKIVKNVLHLLLSVHNLNMFKCLFCVEEKHQNPHI